jgi:hypothetical protein
MKADKVPEKYENFKMTDENHKNESTLQFANE